MDNPFLPCPENDHDHGAEPLELPLHYPGTRPRCLFVPKSLQQSEAQPTQQQDQDDATPPQSGPEEEAPQRQTEAFEAPLSPHPVFGASHGHEVAVRIAGLTDSEEEPVKGAEDHINALK